MYQNNIRIGLYKYMVQGSSNKNLKTKYKCQDLVRLYQSIHQLMIYMLVLWHPRFMCYLQDMKDCQWSS